MGQVPQWLNAENSKEWKDGHVQLKIKHHAQIFRPYVDNVFNRYASPSFLPSSSSLRRRSFGEKGADREDSYAIEAQFGNLENISENL